MRYRPALAIVLLPLLLAGCQHYQAAPAGRTVVTVWSGWSGEAQQTMEQAVAAFNHSQDRIWVENMSTQEDDGKIMRALTAGVPPDCFFLWEPAYVGALAANHAILPLDDFVAESDLDLSTLVAGSVGQCRYRGKLYAMPYLIDTYAFYWSPQAFRAVGLDPERPPRTMSELEEYTKKLTAWERPGRLRRIGFEMPGYNVAAVLFGGRFYDEATGRITADDPRNLEALRWFKHMFDLQGGAQRIDSFSQGYGAYDSPNHQFFTGKVAMMISGEWWPHQCKRYRPDMDFRVGPLPYPDDRPDLKGVTYLGGNFVCIPREAKHPKEAWQFLRWMQTQEAQEILAGGLHNVPNLRRALTSPRLTTGDRWAEAFGQVCRLADSPTARYFPALPVNLLYMNELDSAAQYAARGAKTPEQALRDVQTRVSKELAAWR